VRTFNSPDEVLAAVGEHLGRSEWRLIDQARMDLFSAAVGRPITAPALLSGPVRPQAQIIGGYTYLVLALVPMFLREVVAFPFRKMGVNYGLNRVRFPTPLQLGSYVRGDAELVSAEVVPGCLQIVARVVLEMQGYPDPVCVADAVTRHYL
jgi:acyl dehydratase